MGTGTMPARMAPRKQRTKSSLFGRMSATRSPLRRPSAWSAPPKRALMRSTAVYENDASLASGPRAGRANPGTPVSGTKRKPRVGSALAASSMACGNRAVLHEKGSLAAGYLEPLFQSRAGGLQERFDRRAGSRRSGHHAPHRDRGSGAPPRARDRERSVPLQRGQDRRAASRTTTCSSRSPRRSKRAARSTSAACRPSSTRATSTTARSSTSSSRPRGTSSRSSGEGAASCRARASGRAARPVPGGRARGVALGAAAVDRGRARDRGRGVRGERAARVREGERVRRRADGPARLPAPQPDEQVLVRACSTWTTRSSS